MRLFGRSSIETVAAGALPVLLAEGAVVVDVRTSEEWAAGHLAAARHIPLGELSVRARELDPQRMFLFVCRSGSRSAVAAQALAPQGFTVANLGGGMKACARSGLPVVRDDGSAGRVI